jgi:hypothetical protein
MVCESLLLYLIGKRRNPGQVMIGSMEIRGEMKTVTAEKEEITGKAGKTRRTGERKTEEKKLIIAGEVQVMEVRSC